MLLHKNSDFLDVGLLFFFLSSEESDTFSVNLTQRQSCNFLDSYNLHIYAFNDLFMYLFI